MKTATAWAIFNSDGQPIPHSVRVTRTDCISWLVGLRGSTTECRRRWRHWRRRRGFSVRKVVIQEYTDG